MCLPIGRQLLAEYEAEASQPMGCHAPIGGRESALRLFLFGPRQPRRTEAP